jgi:thiol-disulfide isomerase/thioredoxin
MKVLKFGAVWCPGCIVMKPRWQKIETELPWLETQYFDYDQDKVMVEKYNIGRDIPVFIFLDKEGNEFNRMKGEIDKKDLIKFLEENKNK